MGNLHKEKISKIAEIVGLRYSVVEHLLDEGWTLSLDDNGCAVWRNRSATLAHEKGL